MGNAVSVIVPTLNEAAHLPTLVDALGAQERLPDEVIVADAHSTDATRSIAESAGWRVVDGGMPAVGRNAGARVATGDVFVFLDADVKPGPPFLASALSEFERRGFDVAACSMEPIVDRASDAAIMDAINAYLIAMRRIAPHAPGSCIVARRALHEAIGGFDESLVLAEDHDYGLRAARAGKFGVLTSVRIAVSMRRVEEDGLAQTALKYAWSEMHSLARQPIRSTPFEYRFGEHAAAAEALPLTLGNRPFRLDAEELGLLRDFLRKRLVGAEENGGGSSRQ